MDRPIRFLAQLRAFETLTVTCDRCGEQAPLAEVDATPLGFLCDWCVVTAAASQSAGQR